MKFGISLEPYTPSSSDKKQKIDICYRNTFSVDIRTRKCKAIPRKWISKYFVHKLNGPIHALNDSEYLAVKFTPTLHRCSTVNMQPFSKRCSVHADI